MGPRSEPLVHSHWEFPRQAKIGGSLLSILSCECRQMATSLHARQSRKNLLGFSGRDSKHFMFGESSVL